LPYKNLPDAANALFEKVYNASKSKGDTEEVAAKKAWSAVSGAYKKVGDKIGRAHI
jgi:cation transport regulator ChaB